MTFSVVSGDLVRQTPAGQKTLAPLWVPIVLVAVLVASVVGLAYWFGTQNNPFSSSADQARVNKLAAGGSMTAEEASEVNRMGEEFQRQQAGAAVLVPQTEVAGNNGPWMIQTNQGNLLVAYRETSSAKGKINFWVENGSMIIQNPLNQVVEFSFVMRTTFSGGKTETTESTGKYQPKETNRTGSLSLPQNIERLEIWFEDVRVIQ